MDFQNKLYEQLALDFSISVDDMKRGKNLFVKKQYRAGRRIYKNDRCMLQALAINGIVVMCSDCDELLDWCRREFEDSPGEWICEADKLRRIDNRLMQAGHQIVYSHLFFIPGREQRFFKTNWEPEFELKWFEKEELLSFRGDKRFSHALEFSKERPDMLAAAAYRGSEIIGMAGASADSPAAWQIGIDVLPGERQQGIASCLTWSLKQEIIKRGYLPFYGTGSSHIQSQRVAYNAGFIPGWWEFYSGRL